MRGTDPAKKKKPGPWRRRPPDKEGFIKALGPLTWSNYRPPEGPDRVYEKRRHAFIQALDLNPVYTPVRVYVDHDGRTRNRSGRVGTAKYPKSAIDRGEMGGSWTYPSASFERSFPGFLLRRRKICYLSHVAVQCGVHPSLYKDLKALNRLFWRVDIHGHFDRLVRRINLQLRTKCGRTRTKPVVVNYVTTKPRFNRENRPVWGPICQACCHATCNQIRSQERRSP